MLILYREAALGAEAVATNGSHLKQQLPPLRSLGSNMQYQLVIQFKISDEHEHDLDQLIDLETQLEENAKSYKVDGHDFGSGEMNIFLIASDPQRAFGEIEAMLPSNRAWVAAFRSVRAQNFSVLAPSGVSSFSIK